MKEEISQNKTTETRCGVYIGKDSANIQVLNNDFASCTGLYYLFIFIYIYSLILNYFFAFIVIQIIFRLRFRQASNNGCSSEWLSYSHFLLKNL